VFRSTLEARWAVFFDCLGIEYHYEPDHYEVETGGRTIQYKPDFFLPGLKKYIEIKPTKPYHLENVKAAGWTKHIGDIVLLFNLNPPTDDLENGWLYRYDEDYHNQTPTIDDDICWGECPKCYQIDLNEFGWPLSCGCFTVDQLDQMNNEEEATGKPGASTIRKECSFVGRVSYSEKLEISERRKETRFKIAGSIWAF